MDSIREILKRLQESHRLNEMAIINPQLCQRKSIQVEVEQRDEGPIPHIHVYLDSNRNKHRCAYIRLDKPEYSTHHEEGQTLNSKQKEEFIQVMSTIWDKEFIQSINSEKTKKATGYEAAVKIWIDTFGETIKFSYDDQGFPIIPNYENL